MNNTKRAVLLVLLLLSLGVTLAAQTQPVRITGAALTAVESLAIYLQPGTITRIRSNGGTDDDETQVKGTAGVLLSVSGRNTHASLDAFVRCTNATAANTTPGSTAIYYELYLPYGGGWIQAIGPGGGTFSTALTCYIVTGEADSDATDAADGDVAVNVIWR